MVATLVRRTAKDLAGAFYENQDVLKQDVYQRSERFRAAAPDQKTFVSTNWPYFVKPARQILAQMLTEPGRSQREKDQIYDALLKDRKFLTDEDEIAPSIYRIN